MLGWLYERLRRKRGEKPAETGEEMAEAPYGTLAGVPMTEEESARLTISQVLVQEYRAMMNGMLNDFGITEGQSHAMGNNMLDVWDGEKASLYQMRFIAGDLSLMKEAADN